MNDPDLLIAAAAAAGYDGTRQQGLRSFAEEVLNVDERNARRWRSGERELQGTVRVVCAAIVARPELARELRAARVTLQARESSANEGEQ